MKIMKKKNIYCQEYTVLRLQAKKISFSQPELSRQNPNNKATLNILEKMISYVYRYLLTMHVTGLTFSRNKGEGEIVKIYLFSKFDAKNRQFRIIQNFNLRKHIKQQNYISGISVFYNDTFCQFFISF